MASHATLIVNLISYSCLNYMPALISYSGLSYMPALNALGSWVPPPSPPDSVLTELETRISFLFTSKGCLPLQPASDTLRQGKTGQRAELSWEIKEVGSPH